MTQAIRSQPSISETSSFCKDRKHYCGRGSDDVEGRSGLTGRLAFELLPECRILMWYKQRQGSLGERATDAQGAWGGNRWSGVSKQKDG